MNDGRAPASRSIAVPLPSPSASLPLLLAVGLTALLALTWPGSLRAASTPATSGFPALNTPASTEHHSGKFIWADLFTGEPKVAAKFYCNLFGWTSTKLEQGGRNYIILSNRGQPVAGIVTRANSRAKQPSRWIGYVSVADLTSTISGVTDAGGRVMAPPRDFPDRGRQAIVADAEGAVVGMLESSSGDGADDEPTPGEWNWFELFVRDPHAATPFYHQVFLYDVKEDTRTERKNDYLLSSGDLARAGVAPLPDWPDAKPGWLGVVRVARMDETIAKVTKLGGEVLVAPEPAALGSRFAVIADPTGGSVALIEYVDNANPANRP